MELLINAEMLKLKEAYSRSQIPIDFLVHCLMEIPSANFDEDTSNKYIVDFAESRGTLTNLLHTADMAVLVTSRTSHEGLHGEAFVDQLAIQEVYGAGPVAWIRHGVGWDTLAHEIGHIFGAYHDDQLGNKGDEFAYGYLIPGTEYGTIMT